LRAVSRVRSTRTGQAARPKARTLKASGVGLRRPRTSGAVSGKRGPGLRSAHRHCRKAARHAAFDWGATGSDRSEPERRHARSVPALLRSGQGRTGIAQWSFAAADRLPPRRPEMIDEAAVLSSFGCDCLRRRRQPAEIQPSQRETESQAETAMNRRGSTGHQMAGPALCGSRSRTHRQHSASPRPGSAAQ